MSVSNMRGGAPGEGGRGTAGGARRRAPRPTSSLVEPRAPLFGIVFALLLTLALVPLLRGLAPDGFPIVGARPAPSAPATAIATATATATSTPGVASATDPQAAAELAYVNDMIAHMSLDEEIGQMIVMDFVGTGVTPDLVAKIQQYHVGGAIFYDRNITSAAQVRALTHGMQALTKVPLLLAIDQEGGTVNRLARLIGPQLSAEQMGRKNSPAYARQRGRADGQLMYSLGLNVNLAPVVDVQGVPDSQTYMRYRMFGWTPDKVATLAGAYLDGLEQGDHVIGTLKHFPGLGGITADPHAGAAVSNRGLASLQKTDWAPYQALLATGQVGLIMTTHITLGAVDPTTPATLSAPVVTGILRDQLGYQGVIMTDDIYMKGVAARYSFGQRVLGAVLAGHDLICSTFTLGATKWAEQILRDAVTNGQLTKDRIDESVRRILLLKLRYGLLSMPPA